MVKFKQVSQNAKTDSVKNRVVCDVTEYRLKTIYGDMVNWRGTTETEFFSIVFIKGTLTISVEERELRLGRDPINFGLSDKLVQMFLDVGNDTKTQTAAAIEYNAKYATKEVAEVSFTDIMVALEWKYVPNAKIHYDEGLAML